MLRYPQKIPSSSLGLRRQVRGRIIRFFLQFFQNKCFRFLSVIFLFLIASSQLSAIDVEKNLAQLSLEERECLEYFFAAAIKNGHLGHVLFFSTKPACLTGNFILDTGPLFIKGWKVWQEKEHLFPHPRFIIYDEIVDFKDGRKALHLYFINKKTLTNELSKNESLLGEEFSKEAFMQALEEKTIGSLFTKDQVLIGFLLGYGIDSSQAFKQNELENLKFVICAQDGKVRVQETLKSCTCTLDSQVKIFPVSFYGDLNSQEVQILQEKYANEREEIEAIFEGKDLLKTSLEALCQPN